ncbi:MAG: ankyrin repeat [Geobacteraceae bacterium]|nr:MAG: ankyrin repeat [Geobacteraceae bacterium]
MKPITRQIRQRMLYAAEEGKSSLLMKLLLILDNRTDVRDYYGNTPLMLAARNGHTKCVKALIAAGGDIDAENFDYEKALILAAREAHPRMVRLLLEHDAQCNPGNLSNRRALAKLRPEYNSFYRIRYLNPSTPIGENWEPWSSLKDPSELRIQRIGRLMSKVIELLISYGADVNALDEHGDSPLHNFFSFDKNDWVQLLLKHAPDLNAVDSSGYSLLSKAAREGEHDLARLLLASGADPNIGEWKPIHIIAGLAQPAQLLKELIAAGADVNVQDKDTGKTALHEACGRGKDNKEIAQILLEAGADPTIKDNYGFTPADYAMMFAIGSASDELEGLIPFNIGHARFLSTAITGDFDALKAQLPDIMPDKIKTLALNIAIASRKYECCQLLLDNGADPNGFDIRGLTPLTGAVSMVDIDLVGLLLSYKVDLERATSWGQKPLFLACQCRIDGLPQDELSQTRLNMAELLLERGADVEGADNHGWTPLRQAVVAMNDINLARLLLQHGAKPDKKDDSDTSPLQLAELFCSSEMVELLREYMRH